MSRTTSRKIEIFKEIKDKTEFIEKIKRALQLFFDTWALTPASILIEIDELEGERGELIFDKNHNFILKLDKKFLPYTQKKRRELHMTIIHEILHITAYNFELTLDKIIELLPGENNILQVLFMFYEQFIEKLTWIFYNSTEIVKIFEEAGL